MALHQEQNDDDDDDDYVCIGFRQTFSIQVLRMQRLKLPVRVVVVRLVLLLLLGAEQRQAAARTANKSGLRKSDLRQLQQRSVVVPFEIGALQYSDYLDSNSDHAGRYCGSGPVDAKKSLDPKCIDRGGECTVGWTKCDEWLRYDFETEHDDKDVDITIRFSSDQSSKQLELELDGELIETLNGPGKGFDDFEDEKVTRVSLKQGSHELYLHFVHGQINVCSISIDYSNASGSGGDERGPSPSPPSDAFRLKMYHEPGYWWQCDGVCDKSDIDDDKDPKWCLECEGSGCDDGDYALLQSCDREDNTFFNFVPTESRDEYMISASGTDLCLTHHGNYDDRNAEKKNTKMERCSDNKEEQIWWSGGVGDFLKSNKFEIHPKGDATKYCLTTRHHPLNDEDARVERCSNARRYDDSSLWLRY